MFIIVLLIVKGDRCHQKFTMVSSTLYSVILLALGMLYPAYKSFKAVKNSNSQESERWLTYWVVFSCLIATEKITDNLFSWFPLYYESKTTFIIWLLYPTTFGSKTLYNKYIDPFLTRHEGKIDAQLLHFQERSFEQVMGVVKGLLCTFLAAMMPEFRASTPRAIVATEDEPSWEHVDVCNNDESRCYQSKQLDASVNASRRLGVSESTIDDIIRKYRMKSSGRQSPRAKKKDTVKVKLAKKGDKKL